MGPWDFAIPYLSRAYDNTESASFPPPEAHLKNKPDRMEKGIVVCSRSYRRKRSFISPIF